VRRRIGEILRSWAEFDDTQTLHQRTHTTNMGALLSIPLLGAGAIGSVAAPFLASCCGAAATNALCQSCGTCKSSIATRIAYAILFMINSSISWIMLTDWAVKKLEHLTLDYMKITCPGGECYGFIAVHRINFALALLHFCLAMLLLGVRSTRDGRSKIQNGFWGPKIVAWMAFVVISFLLPEKFFMVWGNYISIIGSVLFVLFGLLLLVDFAHSWAETCIRNSETGNSTLWTTILLGGTVSMYLGALTLTILMYVFFAASGCSMNQTVITLNLIFAIAISFIAINPSVQEFNPSSGIAQAALVTIYCTYLTMSAVAAEPEDRSCNPLVRSKGTRTASIVLGAIFTFLAIAYTTTRAATQRIKLTSNSDEEPALVTDEPTRAQMRSHALQAAVESGSLPASALDDDSDDEDGGLRDDETWSTKYDYTIFHLIFILATQYTATLITLNIEPEANGSFVPVGRTYFSFWVKTVSAWTCYAIYGELTRISN